MIKTLNRNGTGKNPTTRGNSTNDSRVEIINGCREATKSKNSIAFWVYPFQPNRISDTTLTPSLNRCTDN